MGGEGGGMIIIFTIYSFLWSDQAFAFSHFEPSIECTVIKVHGTQNAFGLAQFPVLYQSINNNPLSSALFIAGKEFSKINPVSDWKTDDYEKISIHSGQDDLGLELFGKPISRKGSLRLNGSIVADVTCH